MTSARKEKPAQQPLPLTIAEGVHLRLPERIYFDAPALGSSDLSVLAQDPASWWYGSSFNPDRRARRGRSTYLNFGSALHALVLEGEDAYRARCTLEPDSQDMTLARTPSEIRTLLERHGINAAGKFAMEDLTPLVRKHGLGHLVWSTAYASYESAKRSGKLHVTADEDRRLRHMAELVQAHPDLGPGLRIGLSEVSVFYRRPEDPDTLRRARFDKLQPEAILDLKSMSNPRGMAPEDATFESITNEDYDLQAEDYREARTQAVRFIREGRIYAWDEAGGQAGVLKSERAVLDQVAAAERWRWVWLFYQVRNDAAGSERAPVIVPWWTWPEGPMFDDARVVIDRALTNFKDWRDRYGLTQPWSEIRAIRALPTEKLKRLHYKRNPQ